MPHRFEYPITGANEIRDILGHPQQKVLDKSIPELDHHCQDFIQRSPFVLIASCSATGAMDVSPKGDPPGFVHILDSTTLVIPDRVGNRRADTLCNLVENPNTALLFLVPGKQETLRVNGTAQIVRDQWIRERMAVKGKVPDLAIVVSVQEAFIHCAKCMIRSSLWDAQAWPDTHGLASIAQMMVDHTRTDESLESIQAAVDESYRDRLY